LALLFQYWGLISIFLTVHNLMGLSHFTVDQGLSWANTLVQRPQIFVYHLLTGFKGVKRFAWECLWFVTIVKTLWHSSVTAYTLNFFMGLCTFTVTASTLLTSYVMNRIQCWNDLICCLCLHVSLRFLMTEFMLIRINLCHNWMRYVLCVLL
jgi:hypothetical protein